jgi:hypothetical protein
MSDFAKLKPALVLRRMPRNGNNSSEDINDFIEQSIHDVAGIYNFVNQVVIPAFNGLGRTGTFADVDPIADGIDGTTVMVDHDYTDATSPYFYDSGKTRPKTIFEAFLQVVADIDKAFVGINEVKARLGTADEDSSVPTSQATLSEIETKVNFLNGLVTQIRNANAGYLNAGQIASGLADLTINPTSFHIVDADVDTDVGISAAKISGVDLTVAQTHASIPATYDMRDSILRVKEWIEDITGETFASYTSNNTTAAVTVVAHINNSGTGTIGVGNPHAQDLSDFTDNNTILRPTQILADFDVRPSGVTPAYWGGYAYMPIARNITSASVTLGNPGTTGIGVVLWKWSGGAASVVHSGGLLLGTTTPGSASQPITASVAAGDLLYVSGVVGNGSNARVQVFGY